MPGCTDSAREGAPATVALEASRRYTPAEYLAFERQADWKHEYIDGCIVAMSGTSKEHTSIAVAVIGMLYRELGDGPCAAFNSDTRVRNPATGCYTYPDASVVCGEPEFENAALDTLLNPSVIIEILSPSTELYDRGDKFAAYRRLASLKEYVLIAQDRASVEHYLRRGEQWLLTPVSGLDASVTLPTIGCTLALREIYRRVQFPAEPSATTESRA